MLHNRQQHLEKRAKNKTMNVFSKSGWVQIVE
jgi:hypothetical protein